MGTNVAETATAERRPSLSAREERGRQIAKLGGIHEVGARYSVPSQSPGSPPYLVDLVDQTCTCDDYELRRKPCKHYEAVLSWIAAEGKVADVVEIKATKRKPYQQNWSVYNAAQTREKEMVAKLLAELCAGLETAPQPRRRGQQPLRSQDKIFAAVAKVYTTFSGRRASTDIRDFAEGGYMKEAPAYNSVFRTMEDAATTEILVRLIEESAAPLAAIENIAGQFAQDSTGFSTVTYDRWFDQKHGKLHAEHEWVKLHIMIGTVTNVVTGVKVSGEADCPLLPDLLKQTERRFKVKEVSADKAYLSVKNLEAIDAVGAVPFVPFKSNSVGMSHKSALWKRMWCHFSLKAEDFLARYHRRSNAESTMWMIKSKWGGAVRSKLPAAQMNEVLCKVLCHNLACLVHAVLEFDIDAEFWKPPAPTTPTREPHTPPTPRTSPALALVRS